MNSKNTKKPTKGGLGRSLAELLSDNDELVNMDSKVLMHRDDGTSVKIYNKPDSSPKKKPANRKTMPNGAKSSANPPNYPPINRGLDMDEPSNSREPSTPSQESTGGSTSSKLPPSNWRTKESRIEIGKSRVERREESQGIYRHGKPHVVGGGASEPIKITPNSSKREAETPRIVIGDGSNSSRKTTAEGLEQLDRYRPTVKDAFLEDLLELSESMPSRSYETDSEGRIIIGSQNRARVKKRQSK